MKANPVSQLAATFALGLLAVCAAAAPGAEQVWIPMKVSSFFSGEKTIKLEATLYKPDGEGPFPLLLFSHGSASGSFPPTRTVRPDWLAELATRRGFVLLAPMRRGRGASEGSYDELSSCEFGQLDYGMRLAIEDTDAALAFARTLPYVDARRIVLGGQSRGGILSVAYAAKRPGVALAVVNFVGGWHGEGCRDDFNAYVYAESGRAAKIPMLWLYAENDRLYSPNAIRKWSAAFEQAGGRLSFRLYPHTRGDGHFFYRQSQQWKQDFESFVDGLGLKAN